MGLRLGQEIPEDEHEPRGATASCNALGAVAVLLGVRMVALIDGPPPCTSTHEARARGSQSGVSAVDSAVFALFGLLIAFTFSGAGSRFDARRALVTAEGNSIGTAGPRADENQGVSTPYEVMRQLPFSLRHKVRRTPAPSPAETNRKFMPNAVP